ncbi:hypothetical protein V6N12_023845 [Hibiscus sabdariffa]|uniref:Uncharacterized protein n=1 Tax=Hibiscus sabdariffa TaxID=183260 RepID=A0ABR2FYV1_9ROSI
MGSCSEENDNSSNEKQKDGDALNLGNIMAESFHDMVLSYSRKMKVVEAHSFVFSIAKRQELIVELGPGNWGVRASDKLLVKTVSRWLSSWSRSLIPRLRLINLRKTNGTTLLVLEGRMFT